MTPAALVRLGTVPEAVLARELPATAAYAAMTRQRRGLLCRLKSDPRQTRDMSEDDYETVVAVLLDPLALESFHIVRLGDFLFDLPDFRARARERGIDPQRIRDQLNAFAYAEKLHLVDAAQVRNAPPLAAAPAGEPRARRKAR